MAYEFIRNIELDGVDKLQLDLVNLSVDEITRN